MVVTHRVRATDLGTVGLVFNLPTLCQEAKARCPPITDPLCLPSAVIVTSRQVSITLESLSVYLIILWAALILPT